MTKRKIGREIFEALLLGFIGACVVSFFMVIFGMWQPNSNIELPPIYGYEEVTDYENLFPRP